MRVAFESSNSHTRPTVHLAADWGLECKILPTPFSHACLSDAMLPAMVVMDSAPETVRKPQLHAFLLEDVLVMVSLHSRRTVTETMGKCCRLLLTPQMPALHVLTFVVCKLSLWTRTAIKTALGGSQPRHLDEPWKAAFTAHRGGHLVTESIVSPVTLQEHR